MVWKLTTYYCLLLHAVCFFNTISLLSERDENVGVIIIPSKRATFTKIELFLLLPWPLTVPSNRISTQATLSAPLLSLVILPIHSAAATTSEETMILNEGQEDQQEEERFHQVLCSSLSAASAWFVLVIVSYMVRFPYVF